MLICNKVSATKITKQKPRKIAHTLCSRGIKFKIRECVHDKYLLHNVLTMILNPIIHQPLLDTSEAFSLSWTADNYNSLYLTLQGICLSNMQQING